jgi:asparagine synthase (glutamine-hydrolysing)
MLEKLNGMFAICIIDLRRNHLYLARDRMGIKPLYYFQNKDTFMFSSEIKSFLFNSDFKPELNKNNLAEYAKFGHLSGQDTLLKNVYCLKPGQYVLYKNNTVYKKIYWDMFNGTETLDIGFNSAMKLIEEELSKSLKLRLRSDVKIGCQLSGGIDSSLITLITANNLKDYDLNSVSIIHDDVSSDEEKWIDIATNITGVKNHKFKLTDQYFWENFEKATWHFDAPIFSQCIGIHLLAKNAKNYFTVFLSGEGADELFGGYTRFQRGKTINNKIINTLLRLHTKRWKNITSYYIGSSNTKKFDPVDWLITRTSPYNNNTLQLMIDDIDISQAMSKRRSLFDEGNGDFIRKVQRYELKTWLVNLLMRQDKMTMASAIENRVPFMDHNLVDIVRKLPTSHLVRISHNVNKNSKIILKRIALKYFDKDFVYRSKMGFPIPVHQFFTGEKFNSWLIGDMLPSIKNRGIFGHSIIPKLNLKTSLNHGEKLSIIWKLVTFEMWAKIFLDKHIPKI